MTRDLPSPAGQEPDRRRLAVKFRAQEEFSQDYSPLYARLFGLVANWLEEPEGENKSLVEWLVTAGRDRRSLDVTLLLAAGLHRDVLAGEPLAADLARFFLTAGGARSPDAPELEAVLRQTILARRDALSEFVGGAQVQTNETGRGLCWLLPLLLTGWPAARLVDLGASAGLNLVADRRAYRLVDAGTRTTLLNVGLGQPPQFQTLYYGKRPDFVTVDGRALPRIVARDGCDLRPFPLENRADELTLMAFAWGDQLHRLERLREGIEAFKQISVSDAPVRLAAADLPGDLGRFLGQAILEDDPAIPVVIYNTWMTSYLRDKGQSMGYHIDQWAARQRRPVLWLQWEPPRDGSEPPRYGWCAWTADLWQGDNHGRWHFGWVHPHGGEAVMGPELDEWWRFWGQN